MRRCEKQNITDSSYFVGIQLHKTLCGPWHIIRYSHTWTYSARAPIFAGLDLSTVVKLCLTVESGVARGTGAGVGEEAVVTGSSIEARGRGAVVDVQVTVIAEESGETGAGVAQGAVSKHSGWAVLVWVGGMGE